MMLFPLGGGTEHLSAHFYTLGIHNPAVVQGIMQDAFDYIERYHDIELIYYLPPVHAEPDLQNRLTHAVTGVKKRENLLHPSWNGYIAQLKRKSEKKKRGGLAAPNPGDKCLTMLISKQEREYVRCVCGVCARGGENSVITCCPVVSTCLRFPQILHVVSAHCY